MPAKPQPSKPQRLLRVYNDGFVFWVLLRAAALPAAIFSVWYNVTGQALAGLWRRSAG